ncbi:tetronasin resistance transmembrane protein [Bacillus sp. X1(2014)]|nr:tetronasin resistance transmembrane protein [Bacillus sp. X1(2014)]
MKEKFARWEILFTQYLKRDWKKMIIWILGIGLFSAGFVPAFEEIAEGQGLMGLYETLKNPAMIAIVGPTPIDVATDYTLGAMYAHEMLLFCGLIAMVMSVFHVISHTRKEEDLGLTELVRSFHIGRQANSLATMMETILINIFLALFISGVLVSFGAETISVEGSLLFGATVGFAGIIGAGMALVFAQIMPTSSSATGSTLGLIGFLFIVRAGTDISNVDLSMYNPLGWTYLTYPFTNNDWLPLIFALIFMIIVTMIAFSLEGSRDMGAGYFPERKGREYAKKSLLSVRGLFFKINKGIFIGWVITFIFIGSSYGAIYGDMQAFIESNEIMKQMFSHSGISIEESFTGTIMMVMIVLVSILPILIVNKLFTEERRLRLSQLFSTKVTRKQLYWNCIGLAIFASIIGILLAAGSLGGTAISVMESESTMDFVDFIAAGFNYLPSVLFMIGLATLTLGWIPKFGKVVYFYLGYCFSVNYFGAILDIPEWVSKIAILSWLPQLPIEEFEALTFITISVISIVLMAFGYLGYIKRDMMEGT